MFWPIYILQYIVVWYKLKKHYKDPLVIILTIGKVGSSSVYYSIKEQLTKRVFHIHYISDYGVKKSWKKHKSSSRKSVPLHLITSRILSKFLKRITHKFYIVTVFREPIQRKVSSFFQNLDQFKDEVELKGLDFDTNKVESVLNDDYFLNILDDEDLWIKNELINTFGFSVYNKNEIQSVDFAIERKENVELLMLKMEDLNTVFKKASSKFFSLDKGVELNTYNDGSEKYYSKSYRQFKNKFKLETTTLDKYCQTNYFDTFYSDMKSNVFKKWKK